MVWVRMGEFDFVLDFRSLSKEALHWLKENDILKKLNKFGSKEASCESNNLGLKYCKEKHHWICMQTDTPILSALK